MNTKNDKKIKMMIVGAFPKKNINIQGGILTSCNLLLQSSLPEKVDLILADTLMISVPPPPIAYRIVKFFYKFAEVLYKYIFYRPDVVLLFTSVGASYIEKGVMAIFAKILGIKVLLFPRGTRIIDSYNSNIINSKLVFFFSLIPDIILCQGDIYKEFFIKKMRIKEKKCIILKNWTATKSLLDIGSIRKKTSTTVINIVYIGWINKEKGIFELMQAFKEINKKNSNTKLIIAGNGAEKNRVEQYVENNNLMNCVKLTGWINETEKEKLLMLADIFVLPSYTEGTPNVVIEAMASGLPVIVTRVGTVEEMIKDGENGLLINPKSTDQITEALQILINNPDLRYTMGQSAWKTANDNYNTEKVVDTLIDISKK